MPGRYGSLCSGVGALDLAVEEVFGATQVWHAELDKDAAKVMARHWGTPNLGDITGVDWEQVEPVDLICAGPPCQPVSVAGKQKGEDDERWLWPDVLRAVERLHPRWLVFENPPGIAPWLPAILRRLAEMGYVGRYGRVAAGRADADPRVHAGACHTRERIFIAAHPSGEPGGLQPVGLARSGRAAPVADAGAGALAHADGEGLPAHVEEAGIRDVRGAGRGGDGPAADADSIGPVRERAARGRGDGPTEIERPGRRDRFPWGRYAPAIERWERIHGPAPWPVVEGTRSLSGDFTAWMMGMEPGWMDGLSNTAKKRCAGNAVVTAQAVAAIRELVSDD